MEYINSTQVVSVLRNEYDEWIELLSDEEKRAIRKYSYNSFDNRKNRFFARLNAFLRGDYNKSDSEMLLRYADIIKGAISKHSLKHAIICYRGIDFDYVKGYEIGTIFTFDQFISTSVIDSKSLKKEYKLIIYAPVGTSGAYIEKLSAFPKQREFLLNSDCYYKLLSYKNKVATLEVVV